MTKQASSEATGARNLSLWESVQTTDPKYTKGFNRGGGFKGTSTNATYLAKRATERFGPMGIGWGVNVLDEEVLTGAPILDNEGGIMAHDMIHKVRVNLWYMLDGERGVVEQFGQTQFVGVNRNGVYTDEEAPKKSITDAMTKCLSLLGFAADIHLGLYDDNKYVSDLQHQFAGQPEDDPQPGPPRNSRRDNGTKLSIKQHTEAMLGAETMPALKKAFALAWKQYENPADPADNTPTQLTFKKTYEQRKAELDGGE